MYELSQTRVEDGSVNTEFEPITAQEAQQIAAYADSVVAAFKSEAPDFGHNPRSVKLLSDSDNFAAAVRIMLNVAWQPGGDRDPTWIDNVEKVQGENEEIFSFDNWAMGYFAQRCTALANDTSSVPVLSIAELGMIAALLDLMVEFREIDLARRGIVVRVGDMALSQPEETAAAASPIPSADPTSSQMPT
jgi:hypothetical protein